MPLIPDLRLLWKLSDLRDEATRAVVVVPQIKAALSEPLVYRKLELFAPIASEVCLIVASAVKDLAPDMVFGAAGDTEADQEDELRAIYAAQGLNYEGVKDFFVKLRELAKQIHEELKPYLPYLPFIVPFLSDEQ